MACSLAVLDVSEDHIDFIFRIEEQAKRTRQQKEGKINGGCEVVRL
jgi:hypothetical protein